MNNFDFQRLNKPSTSLRMLVSAEKAGLLCRKVAPAASPASDPSVRPFSGTHTIPKVALHLSPLPASPAASKALDHLWAALAKPMPNWIPKCFGHESFLLGVKLVSPGEGDRLTWHKQAYKQA